MSFLRGLARFAVHPQQTYHKISTGLIPDSCFNQLGAAAACDRQQCSSLISFMQSKLFSSQNAVFDVQRTPLNRQTCLSQLVAPVRNWQPCFARGFASKLRPRFTGCKLKPYSSYKERFKMTGTGKIRYMRPGAVHKHFNKNRRQNAELSKTKVLYETYAKNYEKAGFHDAFFLIS